MSKPLSFNPFRNWTPLCPELHRRIRTTSGVRTQLNPWKHWTPERPELLIRRYPKPR